MATDGVRMELHGRRANGLVRVLRVLLRPIEVRLLRNVVRPEARADELADFGERLFGNASRVGSHVRDQADCPFARQLDPFVELLRDHHRLLDREPRGLLQLARDERRNRALLALFRRDRADRPQRVPQVGERRVCFLLVPDLDVGAVTLQQLRVELGRLRAGETRRDVPVLLGYEPVDLALTIAHQLQGDRLHTARRSTRGGPCPRAAG